MRPASQSKHDRSRSDRLHFIEGVRNCRLNRAWTVATEFFIQCLQSLYQVGDMLPRIRPAGGGAKMSATAERPVSIDGAAAIPSEHRAGPVISWYDFLATACADSAGGEESLTFGQHGCFPCEEKLAALRAHGAAAFQRALAEDSVDGLDLYLGSRRCDHESGIIYDYAECQTKENHIRKVIGAYI